VTTALSGLRLDTLFYTVSGEIRHALWRKRWASAAQRVARNAQMLHGCSPNAERLTVLAESSFALRREDARSRASEDRR